MSEQKMISEREAVMRERAAFVAGAERFACEGCKGLAPDYAGKEAAERYPLPTVTRPRVVTDPHLRDDSVSWRVFDGVIQYRENRDAMLDSIIDSSWVVGPPQFIPTAERVAMWADLLANPTEEVEASDA